MILVKKIVDEVCKEQKITVYNHLELPLADGLLRHWIIGRYKDYIVVININGMSNKTKKVPFGGVILVYNPETCKIPKSVVFDVVNMAKNKISGLSCNGKRMTVNISSAEVDTLYNKLESKYSKEYKIKKGMGYVTLTMRSVKVEVNINK